MAEERMNAPYVYIEPLAGDKQVLIALVEYDALRAEKIAKGVVYDRNRQYGTLEIGTEDEIILFTSVVLGSGASVIASRGPIVESARRLMSRTMARIDAVEPTGVAGLYHAEFRAGPDDFKMATLLYETLLRGHCP